MGGHYRKSPNLCAAGQLTVPQDAEMAALLGDPNAFKLYDVAVKFVLSFSPLNFLLILISQARERQ